MEIMDREWMPRWLRRATGNEDDSVAAKADGRRLKVCRSRNCTNTFPHQGNRLYCTSECYRRDRIAKKPEWVKCTECKKKFKPAKANSKRCSASCRRAYNARYNIEINKHNRKKREENRLPKTCRNCGATWIPKDPRTLFCCSNCKKRHRRLFINKFVSRAGQQMLDKSYSREVDQQDIRSSEFAEEIEKFKKSGGKVTVLPGEIAAAAPDVYVLGEGEENAEEEYADHYRNTPPLEEK